MGQICSLAKMLNLFQKILLVKSPICGLLPFRHIISSFWRLYRKEGWEVPDSPGGKKKKKKM